MSVNTSTPVECEKRLSEFDQVYNQAKDVIAEIKKNSFKIHEMENQIDQLNADLVAAEKEYKILMLRCTATEIKLPDHDRFKKEFASMLESHRNAHAEAREVDAKIESLKKQIGSQIAIKNCYKATIEAQEKCYAELYKKMEELNREVYILRFERV